MNDSKCRSCGAKIFWGELASGRKMPVDYLPIENGNIIVKGSVQRCVEPFDHYTRIEVTAAGNGTHVSHFATCKQANLWRKKK